MPYVSHPILYPNIVEDRLYQRRIAEAARDKNALVVLPTALGKTVISALVAADILYNYRESRVLVMAPTRPLVMQHRESFRRLLRLPEEDFVILTGKTSADYRMTVWNGSARLVFATPEVVRNDILHQGLKLHDFGLIVVDERHRAVKEYAYTEVCSAYLKDAPYPLILGMTASPGSNIERVEAVCKALSIEHVEYRSDWDPDVKPYINPINVEWKTVDLPKEYGPLRRLIRGMLESKMRILQQAGYLKKDPAYVTRKDLIELGSELRYAAEMSIEEERGPIYHAISYQSQALTLFHMLELLETQGTHTLKAFLEKIEEDGKRSHIALTKDSGQIGLILEAADKVDNPKISALKEIVEKQLNENPNSRILVFTQYRDTASYLVETLNTIPSVKAERFVGQASKLGDKGLTQEKQASLIENLKDGTINTLCATSIAEEGLDIPEVNLVVFYEPVPSEIRYIQRKGRTGRKRLGKAIILAAKKTSDIAYLYASKKAVERMRTTAQTLNQQLKPLSRVGLKPQPQPLTPAEIAEIERLAEVEPVKPVKPVKLKPTAPAKPKAEPEVERVEPVKGVSRAARFLWMRVMQAGAGGLLMEDLVEEAALEGMEPSALKAATSQLEAGGQIYRAGWDRIYSMVTVPAPAGKAAEDEKLYMVEIMKVHQGRADIIVNDEVEAVLHPEDFEGPTSIIKKNTRFRARGELYGHGATPSFRVEEVVELLP